MSDWRDTIMSKRQQAKVWLEAEQKAGFLHNCDIKGVLSDPNLFGEDEQMHSQTTAQAQAEISFKAGQETEKAHWAREIEEQVHAAYQGGKEEGMEEEVITKIVSIKDAECQVRVERILKLITEDFVEMVAAYFMTEEYRKRTYELWQGVKSKLLKQEGIK